MDKMILKPDLLSIVEKFCNVSDTSEILDRSKVLAAIRDAKEFMCDETQVGLWAKLNSIDNDSKSMYYHLDCKDNPNHHIYTTPHKFCPDCGAHMFDKNNTYDEYLTKMHNRPVSYYDYNHTFYKNLENDKKIIIIPEQGIKFIHDGMYSFNELYQIIALLFAAICNESKEFAWKSLCYPNGSPVMYYRNDEEYFIAGISTIKCVIAMTFEKELYWDLFKIKELPEAPEIKENGSYDNFLENLENMLSLIELTYMGGKELKWNHMN